MLLSRCAARAASGALRAVVPRAVAPRVSAAPRWAAEGRRREAPAGGVVAHARGLAARARAAGKGKVRARLMGLRLRLGLGLGLGLGGGGVGQPAGRQGERSEGLAGRDNFGDSGRWPRVLRWRPSCRCARGACRC